MLPKAAEILGFRILKKPKYVMPARRGVLTLTEWISRLKKIRDSLSLSVSFSALPASGINDGVVKMEERCLRVA